MKWRAKYQTAHETIQTKWHESAEVAQDYIGKRIGWFPYLGRVNGDTFENGQCTSAPRRGGLVTLESR